MQLTKYHPTWFKQEREFTALHGLKRLDGHQLNFDQASGFITLLFSVMLSTVCWFLLHDSQMTVSVSCLTPAYYTIQTSQKSEVSPVTVVKQGQVLIALDLN